MNIDEVNKSVKKLIEKQYSCSQITLGVLSGEIGMDIDKAMRIASCFGGGMGRGDTCGAVSGALMAIGFLSGGTPEEKEVNHERTSEFVNAFIERTGSCYCRDHLGFDLSTPEGGEMMQSLHEAGTPPEICETLMNTVVEMVLERLESFRR